MLIVTPVLLPIQTGHYRVLIRFTEFDDTGRSNKKLWNMRFEFVLCRIRIFPTLISKHKWLGSELPLRNTIGLDLSRLSA